MLFLIVPDDILAELLSDWLYIPDLVKMDISWCDKMSRHHLLQLFKFIITKQSLDIGKILSRKYINTLRCDTKTIVAFINWICSREIVFQKIVCDSKFNVVLNISEAVSFKSVQHIVIQNFEGYPKGYPINVASVLNSCCCLKSITFHNCDSFRDNDIESINIKRLLELDVLESTNNKYLGDKSCVFFAGNCKNLTKLIFTYAIRDGVQRGLKQETIITMVQNCHHLRHIEVQLLSLSDKCLNTFGDSCRSLVSIKLIVKNEPRFIVFSTNTLFNLMSRCIFANEVYIIEQAPADDDYDKILFEFLKTRRILTVHNKSVESNVQSILNLLCLYSMLCVKLTMFDQLNRDDVMCVAKFCPDLFEMHLINCAPHLWTCRKELKQLCLSLNQFVVDVDNKRLVWNR